jgi:hypothetical protein
LLSKKISSVNSWYPYHSQLLKNIFKIFFKNSFKMMLKSSEDAYQLEKAIAKLSHISQMENRLTVFQYQEPPCDQICGQYSQEEFEGLQDQINAKLRAKARHTQAQAGHALKDQAGQAACARRRASHTHVGSFCQLQDSDSDQGSDSDDSESNYPDIIEGEQSEPAVDCRVQNLDLRVQNPDLRVQNSGLRVQNPDLEFDEVSKINDDQETFGRNAKNCELLMVTHGTSKPKIRFYTNIFAKDKMGIPKTDISRIFTTGDSSDSDEGLSDSDEEQEIHCEVSGINYPVNPVVIELTSDLRVQNPDLKDQNPDLPDLETNDDHETFGCDGVDETKNKLLDLYRQAFERMRGQNPDFEDQYLDLPDLDGNSETNDDNGTFGNAGEDDTNGEFDPLRQSQLLEIERHNPDFNAQNPDSRDQIERQLPDDLYLIQDSETNDDHETFGNADVDDTNGEFDPYHQSQRFEIERQNPDFRHQNPDFRDQIESQLLDP